MTKLRQFLLLAALLFSFGGFTFYASVVVPIGGDVLGKTAQGFVTRRVTPVINLSTAITVVLLAWEIAAEWAQRRRRVNVLLTTCAAAMAACCLTLIALHARLDVFLIDDGHAVSDPEEFYGLHRVYLWTSTVQWLFTLPIVWQAALGFAESSVNGAA
jgi:hypothetical protein